MNRLTLIGTLLAAMAGSPALAQDGAHAGHMNMDHGAMQGTNTRDPGAMKMDQGSMKMDAPAAPEGARDPDAYSGGYTLERGPYVLPGPRQLRFADEHRFATLWFDRLERVDTHDATVTAWDAQARIGRDYDKLALKSEGDYGNGRLEEARTEVLWTHAIASFWDTQLGWRHDSGGTDPERDWLAIGVQGLAPYWFEVDATAYVGERGRSALRLSAEYELLLTQRLILQPRAEINVYGKRDEARGIGAGLSDALAGIRLRYEFSRQFAPYAGVEWSGRFGQTADLARQSGTRAKETRLVAGVRMWF
ncbi:copper resistance protein B [Nitrogeniibacter mangrovi]|uniref:Copper resistance protein B n=1 Tax=Nitrogeniibacter mangrovi TaxID=2016596 RepID=A0A6C1B3F0_9RHOO|nr:copper resistance protein B [Nitrogeniibacter mangrovi]QID17913.1 copper resistance protein B [Nitrogeniibacter mangrovi]